MKIKNYDEKNPIPEELYFGGIRYKGPAAFINGYNGHNSTKDDGVLCALIQRKGMVNKSCWNNQKKPNYLTTKDGSIIKATIYRGQIRQIQESRTIIQEELMINSLCNIKEYKMNLTKIYNKMNLTKIYNAIMEQEEKKKLISKAEATWIKKPFKAKRFGWKYNFEYGGKKFNGILMMSGGGPGAGRLSDTNKDFIQLDFKTGEIWWYDKRYSQRMSFNNAYKYVNGKLMKYKYDDSKDRLSIGPA